MFYNLFTGYSIPQLIALLPYRQLMRLVHLLDILYGNFRIFQNIF